MLTRFSGTFAGDSLTLSSSAGAMWKNTTQSVNLILDNWTGSFVNAQTASSLDGTITGTGSIGFTVAGATETRNMTLNSQLLAGNTFTTITVTGSTSTTGDFLKITNGSNVFTGIWDVDTTTLWGSVAGSLGASSFNVGTTGILNFDYDFSNESGDLTVLTGGTLTLDQALTFGSATIGGTTLTAGDYAATDLTNLGITATGAGTLTVIPEPATIGMLGLGALITLLIRKQIRR
jgi:hypothetical protein